MPAELVRLELVPEIWLPEPALRAERERARFLLHLVKHRGALKNRVHSVLIAHGIPTPSSDLFGPRGRRLSAHVSLPGRWRSSTAATLAPIEVLDERIAAGERELHALGAEHRYVPLPITCPGSAWILAFTIACESGECGRFPSPSKLIGYSGLT